MKYIFLLILGGLVVFLICSPKAQQLAKSVWLITQTSPYQQVGPGVGLIVVVGDSTAYGTGVKDVKDSIAGRIGTDFPNYEIRTFAKNGRVIGEVTKALEEAKLEKTVDLLLLQIGGNDILQNRTKEQIESDTRAMLIEAKKYATNVVFISSGNVGTAALYVKDGQPDQARMRRTLVAREIFIRLSGELGVTYVDLYTEPENDLFLKHPERYFAIDGLHPSGAGYGLWYEILRPYVVGVLPGEKQGQ